MAELAKGNRQSAIGNRQLLLVLSLVCGLLFFQRLAARDLNASHEGRAAQNAQVLLREGSWGLPRLFDRRLELQKPPLYYWLVAALAYLREVPVDGWAVRLPAAVAALATVALVYFLGWYLGRPGLGFLAALILATGVHFTWLARVGRIDMPLTLTVTLAVVTFYLGQRPDEASGWRWPWFLVFYLAVAAGILFKGPIAAVLTAVTVAAWSCLEKRARPFLATLWWGVPLVVLLAAPWFFWANEQTHHRLWEVFFWHHNVERGLGGEGGLTAHPWWFYGPRLLIDLLPWSLFWPWALWLAYQKKWMHHDPILRLGLVWFVSHLLFLSLMRFKRADYLLPAYPGAALFLACTITRFLQDPSSSCQGKRWLTGLATLAVTGCLLGWLGYLHLVEPRQADFALARRFAAEIRNRTAQPVIFFRAEAHAVAFHVGPPLDTILEWENLDVWANQPQTIYVVMPPDCAHAWPNHLPTGRLEEILRTTDFEPCQQTKPAAGWAWAIDLVVQRWGLARQPDRTLVLLRSLPKH